MPGGLIMPEREFEEGERVGRFVVLRDVEGRQHAVAAAAVAAICDDDGGVLLLLPGGRMIRLENSLREVLRWLECGVRG